MQDDSSEDEQDEVDILNDHFDAYDQILNTDQSIKDRRYMTSHSETDEYDSEIDVDHYNFTKLCDSNQTKYSK